MHLAIQRDVVDHLTAIGLERGAKVVNVDAGKLGHQPVGATRRNPAHDEIVDALLTPSADHVVALFQLGDKFRDLGGVVLQIAIHGQDVVALGMIESRGKRGGLAKIAPQLDHQNPAVHGCNLFQQLVGAVTRSVVHKHQFETVANLLHNRLQAVVQSSNVLFLVMEGHDNRILRHLIV